MSYIGIKPANAVVTSEQIADGVITTADLANSAVTTAKVADNAITTAKIALGAVIPADMANGGREFGMRNRIINGAMQIDQRYAGTAYTSTNGNIYVLDRWKTFETGGVAGRFTVQQNAGSVTPPVGFSNYLGVTSLTGSAVSAGMIQSITQVIEGFNAADLAWGTANAQAVTISFWVRSSLTGTFGGVLSNGAVNYSYPFSYIISSANTWEYKTVTIAGPTAGTWNTTNGAGPTLQFVIGSGTTFQGAAGSWSANGFYGVTGAVNLTGTNGATFYITGVQLEVGSTATSFDYRPYGTELALCQRYFYGCTSQYIGRSITSVVIGAGVVFPVTMRAAPTASGTFIADTGNNGTLVAQQSSVGSIELYNGSANWTTNAGIRVTGQFTAEL